MSLLEKLPVNDTDASNASVARSLVCSDWYDASSPSPTAKHRASSFELWIVFIAAAVDLQDKEEDGHAIRACNCHEQHPNPGQSSAK
jgi:hypothetical protein